MATLSLKPTQRFNIPDWHDSNKLISTNAERQREASHEIRQESRSLDQLTANETKWNQHNSNSKLEDRINDINEWKKVLRRTTVDTEEEISLLEKKKNETEECLRAKNNNTDVVIECLMQRESRQSIDVVRDDVEAELHKENEMIEKIKKNLQKKISESNEQASLLREARQQLMRDEDNKLEADEIDSKCFQMNNSSSRISYKPNPTRVPTGSSTPFTWNQFSQYNKDRANAEVRSSVALREAIDVTMTNSKNELEAQRIATEFAYRKRIHEFEMQEKELIWQRERTLDEIAEMERDIRALEQAIRDKENPLKVAHTRLETRTYRKEMELCRDAPQYAITEEVEQLNKIIKDLKEKLEQAHHARYALYQNLHQIETDLECKRHSLLLDRRCLDIRRRLVIPSEQFVSQIEKDSFNRSYQPNPDIETKLKSLQLN